MSIDVSDQLRHRVCQANRDLAANGLVVGTSGNVSGRDPDTGYIVIKPSGVAFAELTADQLVVVDDHANVVSGSLKPSVDTASHCYVYRHRDDVGGIVHTHSPFATSFAVRGEDVPVLTTTHASLFGAPIPCSGYAVIGEEEVGAEIVRCLGDGSVVLLRSHGVFTIGVSAEKALRGAMYTEECAEVAHLALLRGPVPELDQEVVEASRAWYLADYGQQPVRGGS